MAKAASKLLDDAVGTDSGVLNAISDPRMRLCAEPSYGMGRKTLYFQNLKARPEHPDPPPIPLDPGPAIKVPATNPDILVIAVGKNCRVCAQPVSAIACRPAIVRFDGFSEAKTRTRTRHSDNFAT